MYLWENRKVRPTELAPLDTAVPTQVHSAAGKSPSAPAAVKRSGEEAAVRSLNSAADKLSGGRLPGVEKSRSEVVSSLSRDFCNQIPCIRKRSILSSQQG